MCGVELKRIDGFNVTTALAAVSETGTDMSKFPNDKHFMSWLGVLAQRGLQGCVQAPRSSAVKCSAAKPDTVPIGPRKP